MPSRWPNPSTSILNRFSLPDGRERLVQPSHIQTRGQRRLREKCPAQRTGLLSGVALGLGPTSLNSPSSALGIHMPFVTSQDFKPSSYRDNDKLKKGREAQGAEPSLSAPFPAHRPRRVSRASVEVGCGFSPIVNVNRVT